MIEEEDKNFLELVTNKITSQINRITIMADVDREFIKEQVDSLIIAILFSCLPAKRAQLMARILIEKGADEFLNGQ